MSTYFDKREGRTKTIPDCSKVGCVWDAATQRCERDYGAMSFFAPTIRPGLGYLDDYSYEEDYGFDGGGWNPGYDNSGGGDWYFDGYGYYDDSGNYYDPSGGDSGDGWYDDGSGGYYNDAGDYFYDDGSSYFGLSADGTTYGYDYNSGEQWGTDASGGYYWEGADGSSFYEDAAGNWSSNEADGSVCYGDAAGNSSCSGDTPGDSRSRAQAKKEQNRQAQQRAQSSGGASGGGGSQSRPPQQQQQQQRPVVGITPGNQGMFSKSDQKTLLYIGLAFGALILFKK